MRRTTTLAAILLIMVAGSLGAAEPTYSSYLFPVVAKNSGLAGSNWVTEVCCTNFNMSASLPVNYFFVQGGEVWYWEDNLPAKKTICYSDIIGQLLGVDEWQGALLITSDPDVTNDWETMRFVARVKVYNSTADGNYGLSVSPEIDHFGIGEPQHFEFTDGSDDDLFVGVAPGVQNYGTRGSSGERTSIGYVNFGYDAYEGTFSIWQEVVFGVYDRQGNYLYQERRNVAPLEQAQFTLPSYLEVHGGYAKMQLLGDPYDYWGEPALDFFSYMTITDNRSGDGLYTPFRLPYEGGYVYKKSAGDQKAPGPGALIDALLAKATKIQPPAGEVTRTDR